MRAVVGPITNMHACRCHAAPFKPALASVSRRATAAASRPVPPRLRPRASSHQADARPSVCSELAADINVACNEALQAMLAVDRSRVPGLEERLQALRLQAVEQAQDLQADRLLRVVQGMLRHTVLKEADELTGPHAAAFNRLANQVAGSDWKLSLEGQDPGAAPEEPKFSTWDDVFEAKKARAQGGGGSAGSSSGRFGGGGGVADTSFYDTLGVVPSAAQPDIKAAYRQLALKLHPDVNAAPDAAQRFAAVAAAYDVLSDPESRALYDQFGPEGMRGRAGAVSGSGNSSRAWDEFKPFKRENKRTKARDASAASYTSSTDEDEAGPAPAGQQPDSTTGVDGKGSAVGADSSGAGSDSGPAAASTEQQSSGTASGGGGDAWGARWAGQPQAGAVVEYPLPAVVRAELADGRSHGVGLLVGRNCDRGDARRLPEEALDLCEVEPLRQDEAGSLRWVPDELSASAFVRLGELRAVPVDSFDQRFDVWTISAELSEGCGGPELGEMVIL